MGDGFSGPYFLKSERLGFRSWTKEGFPLARVLRRDVAVTRYFGGPFSEDEVHMRLNRELERLKVHKFKYWPIFLLGNKEHVVCAGLRPHGSDEFFPALGMNIPYSLLKMPKCRPGP